MGIENQTGPVEYHNGCPKCDSRELLEISQETQCRNYWYSDNSFPASGAIRTGAKKLELRKYMDKQVSAIAFACPCKPGEPIDITRGGTIETVGFGYYKNWVALDPCEVNEEVVCDEDCDPYEKLPYIEKYRRHVAAKTAALTEAVNTRYELMATFIKLWGAYMIFGPKMDSYMIDFERNTCLCAVMRENYDNINTFPCADWNMWKHMLKKNKKGNTNGQPVRVTFGVDAWQCWHMHHEIQRKGFTKACDCTEPGNDLGLRGSDCGMDFMGTFDGIAVYVDGRTYVDADGVEKYYMPQDAMLMECEGMRGARAHSTIFSPSADFNPGDFHFREWWCEPDEAWTLQVEGSILMFPRNVDTSLLVRNVGRTMSYPGQGCVDRILGATLDADGEPVEGSEGYVTSPPQANKGITEDQWEVAIQCAVDGLYFGICCSLIGRAPPRVPCNNGTKADCIPGKWLTITPGKDPCPTAPKKCVTKEMLVSQGYTDFAIAEAIYYGGLVKQTLEQCLVIPQPLMPRKKASEDDKEKLGIGEQ